MRDLLYRHQIPGPDRHHRLGLPVGQKTPAYYLGPVGGEVMTLPRRRIRAGRVRRRPVVAEHPCRPGPVRPRSSKGQRPEHPASREQKPLAAHPGEPRSPGHGLRSEVRYALHAPTRVSTGPGTPSRTQRAPRGNPPAACSPLSSCMPRNPFRSIDPPYPPLRSSRDRPESQSPRSSLPPPGLLSRRVTAVCLSTRAAAPVSDPLRQQNPGGIHTL